MEQFTKTCTKCGQAKTVDLFCKDNTKKDKLACWCKECQSTRAKTWWGTHREFILPGLRLNSPIKRLEQKTRVLLHYGNGNLACTNCGETDIRCLSIDHVDNNGGMHRKDSTIASSNMYYWLEKNNYPEGYRTLCMNCQFKKSFQVNGYGAKYVGSEVYT